MRPRLDEIDPNMEAVPLENGLLFQDVRHTPACIHGLIEGEYARLPAALRPLASGKLLPMQYSTSGGRVRFLTDSRRLGLRMLASNASGLYNMAYTGYAGIDCYLGEGPGARYLATRCPPLGERFLESEIPLPGTLSLVTLYLPLYSGIERMELGIEPGAALLAPAPYTHEKSIVFYGSSITQGGCASRPSNSYCALVSRWLDSDFTCLGFSGGAKGESWMAEYIASLSMSCFVYDYDYNAPSPEYLRQTHRLFLETILNKNPELPVVALSRPNPDLSGPDAERREIVEETCAWAAAQGVRIWFVDGAQILGDWGRDSCTVDGIHPNDLGFWRMAESVLPCLREALGDRP